MNYRNTLTLPLEKIVSRNNTVCQSKVLILFRTYLLQLADVMGKLS